MARPFTAPAKINLTLEVLARRDDGYHGVRSVMVPLDLVDDVEIEPNDRFAFSCDGAAPPGDKNLAVRALRALGELPAASVTLRKRIPSEAGLGGGSSDAATMLLAAMNGAFGPQPERNWMEIARSLGSDVPFFLTGTGALVEGTGERVTPLGALPQWHALIVKPPTGVSTAWAYAQLDGRARDVRPRNASPSLAMAAALQRGDFDGACALLCNDFQEPVAGGCSDVRTALDALAAAGAAAPLLAGSGSCAFSLERNATAVEGLQRRLQLPPSFARYAVRFARTPEWVS